MKRDKPIMLMFYWVNEMAYMTLTYWEEKKCWRDESYDTRSLRSWLSGFATSLILW